MNLDEKIKQAFKLFQGLRSQEEDQKMLDKIQEMCFGEMLKFVLENLTDEDRQSLEDSINKTEDENSKISLLTDFLTKIPDYQNKMTVHMDSYLEKIVEKNVR